MGGVGSFPCVNNPVPVPLSEEANSEYFERWQYLTRCLQGDLRMAAQGLIDALRAEHLVFPDSTQKAYNALTTLLTTMSDENDVRQQDRAEEHAIVKRVSDVIGDLCAGKVPRTARRDLGDALKRADGAAGVHGAIGRTNQR